MAGISPKVPLEGTGKSEAGFALTGLGNRRRLPVEKYRRRKHEQLHLARAQRCVLKLEQDAGRGVRSGETSWKPSET